VTIYVRTSDDQVNWSPWQAVATSGANPGTPAGRYIQYRLDLSTTNIQVSPSVAWVALNNTGAAQNTVTLQAQDAFARNITSSWGTSETGGSYTLYNGTTADFSVNGDAGALALPTSNSQRAAILSGVSVQDAEITFRVQTNKVALGSDQYAYFVARRLSNGTEYRGRLRFSPNGKVRLQAFWVPLSLVEAPLGPEVLVPNLTHTANTYYRVRAQIFGVNSTTIRMRAWADGQPEPSTWQYRSSNSIGTTRGSGAIGLRAGIASAASNAPVVCSFDDFQVKGIAAP
jgi:hypothetical protein